jgi:hypothetical protein
MKMLVEHGARASTRGCVCALALAGISLPAGTHHVSGVKLEERVHLGGTELVLNGEGVRRTFFRRVYHVALYLTEKKSSSAAVYALPGPKRIRILLLRDVTAGKLVDALTDAIHDNCAQGERSALRGRVQTLRALLLRPQQGARGDVITFDWLPDAGTVVGVNSRPLGPPIPGEDFYRALLRCWLGERPASSGLRSALLGRSQ